MVSGGAKWFIKVKHELEWCDWLFLEVKEDFGWCGGGEHPYSKVS